MRKMDTRKIIQALDYFACGQDDKSIDNMKAYKLLWLADRWHLRQYGRTVSGDEYHALPYGVVPSDAKCILEGKHTKLQDDSKLASDYLCVLKGHRYASRKMPDMSVFSETDREALALILKNYNKYSALELSEISHTFPEWKYYEKKLRDSSLKNGYKIDMNLFFENKDDSSHLFNDPDELLSLTKAVYNQYKGC